MWTLDGAKLRTKREAKGLSRVDLARVSGVGERTLCRIESSEPREVRIGTLTVLAQALSVALTDLASHRDDQAPPTEPAPPRENPLLRPSRLAALAAKERAAGGVRAVETSRGPVERLGPIRLNQLYSSYASYDGATWLVEGVVASDRGVPVAEAALLGVAPGVSTRLRVVQTVAGDELSVTVVVSGAALVREVHDLSARGVPVTLLARTVVAPEGRPSFWTHESETKRPWALVATERVTLEAPRAARVTEKKTAKKRG